MKYLKTFEVYSLKEDDMIVQELINEFKDQKINFNIKYEYDDDYEFSDDEIYKVVTEFGELTLCYTVACTDSIFDMGKGTTKLVTLDGKIINSSLNQNLFCVIRKLSAFTSMIVNILSSRSYLGVNINELFDRCNEFELTKDNKTIDQISLNQIYDFYHKNFNVVDVEKILKLCDHNMKILTNSGQFLESYSNKENDIRIKKLIDELKDQKINLDIKDQSYEEESGEFPIDIIVYSINTEYGEVIISSEPEDAYDDYNTNMNISVEINTGGFTNEWIYTSFENDLFNVVSNLFYSTFNYIEIISRYIGQNYPETLNRCEEFEITKDNKTIDLISLNQIYDFYNLDFTEFDSNKFNNELKIRNILSRI